MPIPLGYYGEAEWKEDRNRWFHTEDYGYTDFDGNLYFAGRKLDMIKIDGTVFFTSEIENMINTHPAVFESTAFEVEVEGKPAKELKLCLVLNQGESLEYEEIYEFLSVNLKPPKVPRFLEFRDNIPKTRTFLIKKKVLKEEWNTKASWEQTWDAKIKDFLKKN